MPDRISTTGTVRDDTEVSIGDTKELIAYLYNDDETPVSADDLVSVVFTIKKPDETEVTDPGDIQDDGSGYLLFDGNDQTGLYVWTAQFVYISGAKKTYRDQYNVYDPLIVPPTSRRRTIADEVWMRIEDCFDSELGGPWLRDETLSYFDPTKVERFVDEGLVIINNWPPLTNFDLGMFTTKFPDPDPSQPAGTLEENPNQIVIVQATLLAVIRHLMRSYTEQELPQGANINWQSRRDYLERWTQIYQIELEWFKELLALWKRQFFNYGHSALLVGQKAGRLGFGTGWRARNALRGW